LTRSAKTAGASPFETEDTFPIRTQAVAGAITFQKAIPMVLPRPSVFLREPREWTEVKCPYLTQMPEASLLSYLIEASYFLEQPFVVLEKMVV
jgi:hypothetical protein